MNYKFIDRIDSFQIDCSPFELYKFFSNHKHGLAYIFDKETYLGWTTYKLYKANNFILDKSIIQDKRIVDFNDYIKDHHKIFEYFKENNVYCAPVFNNDKLIGQFKIYDKFEVMFETSKFIQTIDKLKFYQDEIKSFMKQYNINSVGIILNNSDIEKLPSFINPILDYDFDKYDIVLNGLLNYEIINHINNDKIFGVDDFLVLVLLNVLKNTNFVKNSYFINGPRIKNESLLFDDERAFCKGDITVRQILKQKEYIDKLYITKENIEFINKYNARITTSTFINNCRAFKYIKNSIVKDDIFNNHRIVPSNEGLDNKIIVYGPCISYSAMVCKECSIEEYLKRKLIQNNINFDVINAGIPDGGDILNDLMSCIYDNNPTAINVFLSDFPKMIKDFMIKNNFKFIETSKYFEGEHYWFVNHPFHLSEKGNKIFAQALYNIIDFKVRNNNSLQFLQKIDVDDRYYLIERDVIEYKQYLLDNKFTNKGKTGFIQINASPLTCGHAYLIDYAATHCDNLYVFVVEDNPNALPFYDRFNLINDYCKKYKNVKVLSGSYIIGSILTYNAYFNKEFEVGADPYEDIRNFKDIIMPCLDIDVRFFGEEPHSIVTNALNNAYMNMFKDSNKEILVIPRLESNGEVISASTVRNNLIIDKTKNKDLVPGHVYQYLMALDPEEYVKG